MSEARRAPWQQREGEPDRLYTWFELYRKMGRGRSLRRLRALLHGSGGRFEHPSGSLQRASKTWDWVQRAEAWDLAQARQMQVDEHVRQVSWREERLLIIEQLLSAVSKVMLKAEIGEMSRYEARAWLPAMRLLLRDLLQAQRVELGLPVSGGAPEGGVEAFRADEFAAASKELAEWSQRHGVDEAAWERMDAEAQGELRGLLTDFYATVEAEKGDGDVGAG